MWKKIHIGAACCLIRLRSSPLLVRLLLTNASSFYTTVRESEYGLHIRAKLSEASGVLHQQSDLN